MTRPRVQWRFGVSPDEQSTHSTLLPLFLLDVVDLRCVVLGALHHVSKSAYRLSFLLRGLLSCLVLNFGFHPLASCAATFPQLPSLSSLSMSMVIAVFLTGKYVLLSLLSEDDFAFVDDMLSAGYKYRR